MGLLSSQLGRATQVEVVPGGVPAIPGIFVNRLQPIIPGVPGPKQLRIKFKVEKSITSAPQKCTVKIFNLGRISRERIAGTVTKTIDFSSDFLFVDGRLIEGKDLGGTTQYVTTANGVAYVKLSSGYGGAPSTIFEGSSSTLRSVHVGRNWVTTIEAGDGAFQIQKGIANKSFEVGTPMLLVVDYLVKTMGLFPGFPLTPATVPLAMSASVFTNGFCATGKASDVLNALMLAIGVTWFVDDGDAYFIDKLGSLPAVPVRVSALPDPTAALMLSKPRRLEGDGVEIEMFLNPAVRIGREILIVSKALAGQYRVESLVHQGDNRAANVKNTTTAQLRNLDFLTSIGV